MFCELGLNNAGNQVAREKSKVLCQPFHQLPRPAVCLNISLQLEAKAVEQCAELKLLSPISDLRMIWKLISKF